MRGAPVVIILTLISGCLSYISNERPMKPTCDRGKILVEKPEGFKCVPDVSSKWRPQQQNNGWRQQEEDIFPKRTTTTERARFPDWGFGAEEEDYNDLNDELSWQPSPKPVHNRSPPQHHRRPSYPLPHTRYLSLREEHCLSDKQVYWPADGQCHTLLHRGPCAEGEWLVLEERARAFGTEMDIVCKRRPCPCTAKDPHLCEVLYPTMDTCSPQCRVAAAAEQDGICRPGEQLLLTPLGLGECGCRTDPPHQRWPGDGACYEMFSEGPCPANHTLQYSKPMDELLCVPKICPDDLILYDDGRCYSLNSRGPCDDFSELTLDKETLDPKCTPKKKHQVKRVFDMAPKNLREERERNNILGNLRVQMSPRGGGQKKNKGPSFSSLFGASRDKKASSAVLTETKSSRAKTYLLWLRGHSAHRNDRSRL